ncbi:MAG: nicotinamide-nucleotide amidohydrolase family protein [Pseudomonadota bacterium]
MALKPLIIELGAQLTAREWKLATAESCTGGGVAYYLTKIAGSSGWFERGFVSYSNLAKVEMLGVKQATLDNYGAVSEQTVRAMADGVLSHSQAQVSIAITGIAGPDGGSKDKPVGTVWFGWAGIAIETQTTAQLFTGNRNEIRIQSIQFALETLLTILKP